MSEWKARRFWKQAAATQSEGGFGVALDDRAVRTPAKRALLVPSRALADAIAAEWDAQDEAIRPDTMPLTRAANAAIDKVARQRAEVAAMLAAYAGTDLLCHRADSQPDLAARQSAGWDPLLEACAKRGLPLRAGPGILPIAQPEASLKGFSDRLQDMNEWELTALHDLVALTGSLVLGLAVFDGELGADESWRLSRLDEDYQAELWGIDEEAAEAAAIKQASHADAVRFLELLRHN